MTLAPRTLARRTLAPRTLARRTLAPRTLLVAALVATAAACGSSAPSNGATSSGAHSGSALLGSKAQQDCTNVTNVLSDGPDPDADTVGYAEAQVLPLRQLHVSSAPLAAAVRRLDAAYEAYASTTGAAQDAAAITTTKAEAALDAICPGAAP